MRKTIRILTELSEARVKYVVTECVSHLGLPWFLIAIIEDVLKILNVVFTSYFNKEEQFLINLNLVLKLILFVNIV